MLVVDASALFEVVTDTERAELIRERLAADPNHAAPHVVDIEVFSLIRRDHLAGALDETAAALAVDDLRSWPGERYGHRALLERAWDLRHAVRGWDAAYVALAEVLGATLLTLDGRLARAVASTCDVDLVT
jgi:predicted nucleic acid-binding protein